MVRRFRFLLTSTARMRGFSLVELIVVIAIFSVISMTVLANHSKFNSTVLLSSLAYDVALTIREAQVYGVSVRTFGNQFQLGYGLRFQESNEYIFFADLDKNSRYDPGVDEIVKELGIGRGHSITRLCAYTTNSSHCTDSADPIEHLDIVFVRPEPDANITTNEPLTYSRAEITVSAPGGAERVIVVQSTGQISVGDGS